jgi:hypothetical protein
MSKKSEAVKLWRLNSKQRMVDAMGGKCQICGYDKCNSALSFHHLDPSIKDIGFGGVRANPIAWVKIVQELRKCILLCHNCHNEVHDGMTAIPDNYVSFKEEYLDYKSIYKDSCPVCGGAKLMQNITCSRSCASQYNKKTDWDSIDLFELKKTMRNSDIADMLGVSDTAVAKRLKKLASRVKVLEP